MEEGADSAHLQGQLHRQNDKIALCEEKPWLQKLCTTTDNCIACLCMHTWVCWAERGKHMWLALRKCIGLHLSAADSCVYFYFCENQWKNLSSPLSQVLSLAHCRPDTMCVFNKGFVSEMRCDKMQRNKRSGTCTCMQEHRQPSKGPATSNANSVSQNNIVTKTSLHHHYININIHSTNKTPAIFQSDVYLRTDLHIGECLDLVILIL